MAVGLNQSRLPGGVFTPYQLPSPIFANTPRPFVVYVENSRFLPHFLEESTILRIWSTPVDQISVLPKSSKSRLFDPIFEIFISQKPLKIFYFEFHFREDRIFK